MESRQRARELIKEYVDKSKKKRVPVHMYETPLDPANNQQRKNQNRSNILRVTERIYRDLMPHDGECTICLLDQQKVIPLCFRNCPWRAHYVGGEIWFAESRTGRESPLDYDFFISRGELMYNYNRRLRFILRTGKFYGIELHHKNGTHSDDRFINLAFRDDHAKLQGRIMRLRTMIRKTEALMATDPRNVNLRGLLKHLNEMLKVEMKVTDSPVVEFIIREQMAKFALEGLLSGELFDAL